MIFDFLINIFGFVFGKIYSVYCTFKAIKNKDAVLCSQWLKYWVCHSIFLVVTSFTDVLFSFCIPFYGELKVLFLVFLSSNNATGATLLFNKFVEPELIKREMMIDTHLANLQEYVDVISSNVYSMVASKSSEFLSKFVVQAKIWLINQMTQNNLPAVDKTDGPETNINESYMNSLMGNFFSRSMHPKKELLDDDLDENEKFFIIDKEEYSSNTDEPMEDIINIAPIKKRGRPKKNKRKVDE